MVKFWKICLGIFAVAGFVASLIQIYQWIIPDPKITPKPAVPTAPNEPPGYPGMPKKPDVWNSDAVRTKAVGE